MTLRNAEKITGLEVRVIPSPGRIILLGAFEQQHEVARAVGSNVKLAAGALVDVIYKRRCRQAMNEQGWRCGQCGKIRSLQCHHIIKRSHGRSDLRTNLIALCVLCHEDIERRRIQLEPHPDIVKAVSWFGLTWGGDQWIPTVT